MKKLRGVLNILLLIGLVLFSKNKGEVWGDELTTYYIWLEIIVYLSLIPNIASAVLNMTYKELFDNL